MDSGWREVIDRAADTGNSIHWEPSCLSRRQLCQTLFAISRNCGKLFRCRKLSLRRYEGARRTNKLVLTPEQVENRCSFRTFLLKSRIWEKQSKRERNHLYTFKVYPTSYQFGVWLCLVRLRVGCPLSQPVVGCAIICEHRIVSVDLTYGRPERSLNGAPGGS